MILVIVLSFLALPAALVVAGLLVAGKRVPPLLGVLPAVLPALVLLLDLRWGVSSAISAAEAAPADLWLVTLAAGVAQASSVQLAPLVAAVPAVVLILGGAVAGALRGPRRPAVSLVGGAVVLLAVISVPLVFDHDMGPLQYARLPLYLFLGALTAVALLAGDADRSGPEAAATAALSLPVAGGLLELLMVAMGQANVYEATAMCSPEMQSLLWSAGTSIVGISLSGGLWLVLLAAVVGLVGLGPLAATMSTSRRTLGLAALVWLPLGPALVLGVDAGSRFIEARSELGQRLTPAYSDDFQLPYSETLRFPLLATTLTLDRRQLSIDGGEPVFEAYQRDPTQAELQALRQALTAVQQHRREHVQGLGGDDFFFDSQELLDDSTLLLQLDRRAPWSTAAPVLREAQAAGFEPEVVTILHRVVALSVLDETKVEEPLGEIFQPGPSPDSPRLYLTTQGMVARWGADRIELPCTSDCATTDDYDLRGLTEALGRMKDGRPEPEDVIVRVEAPVQWELVVAVLDHAREDIRRRVDGRPRVLLPFPYLDPEPLVDPSLAALEPQDTLSFGYVGELAAAPASVGTLDRHQIDAVLRRHLEKIQACYERALTRQPGLSGKIVVQFVIDPDGAVSSSSVTSSTMDHPEVEDCVARQFLDMRFPEPEGGGSVTVSYPFIFRSSDQP